MRLWIFSDLHLDVNSASPFALPDPRPAHDVVVIAGDLMEGISNGVRWIADEGLNEKPVIYVPGNHEHYGYEFQRSMEEGRAAAVGHANIHVLDRESVEVAGMRFLGATLWTDYLLFGEKSYEVSLLVASRIMNDHRSIAFADRSWLPTDALAEHRRSRSFIEDALADEAAARTVVVTHTAPSLMSIADVYCENPLTPAFASRLDALVPHARLWIHGHTHIGCDYELGGCRVLNNPRGYVSEGEEVGFDPRRVVEITLNPPKPAVSA